jgi:hypothetical protein
MYFWRNLRKLAFQAKRYSHAERRAGLVESSSALGVSRHFELRYLGLSTHANAAVFGKTSMISAPNSSFPFSLLSRQMMGGAASLGRMS